MKKFGIYLAILCVVIVSAFLMSAYGQAARTTQTIRGPVWEYKVMNVVFQEGKVYIFEDGTKLTTTGELRRVTELGSQGWEMLSSDVIIDTFSRDPNLMGSPATIRTHWFKRSK